MNKKLGRKLALKKETLLHVNGALTYKPPVWNTMLISCGGWSACTCPSTPDATCQAPGGGPAPHPASDACNNTSSSNTVVCPMTRC